MSLIVGLTGGIATGKSTIAQFFKDEAIPVIETDVIARNVTQKGSDVYHAILDYFKEDILLSNGEINRKKLGQIIFSDPEKRDFLNLTVHPAVKAVMVSEIEKCKLEGKKLIIVDVPLLFEAGFDQAVDLSLLVYTDEATQLKRLMNRDDIDKALALQKINAQWPLLKKKELASILLDNSHSVLTTKKAFREILEDLKERAGWDS
jgi:dephospho-CoA kinase